MSGNGYGTNNNFDVLGYLRKIHWKHKPHDDSSVYVECPKCRHPNGVKGEAYIHPTRGLGGCRRDNECRARWNFYQFRELTGDPDIAALKHPGRGARKKKPVPPPLNETPETVALKSEVEEYLKRRGLNPELCRSYGVRAGVSGGSPAVMFPIYREGVLLNRKFRARDGEQGGKGSWKNFSVEKDCEIGLYGRDEAQEATGGEGSLILVEGELDLLAAVQMGHKNVVSIPNASNLDEWLEAEWGWLQGFGWFYLAVDQDSAGENAARELARRIGPDHCSRVRLPKKDLLDCLKAGWTEKDFQQALDAAEEYRPSRLRPMSDFIEESLARHADVAMGDPTPFLGLTGRIRGFRGGEMSYWAGDDGVGKTTLALNIVARLAAEGIASCIGSFELRPSRYIGWMADMIREEFEPAGTIFDVRERLERVAPFVWIIDHVGQIGPDTLLEVYCYAARRYGVRHFITDSLMMLDVEHDDYAQQAAFIKRVKVELVDPLQVHHHLLCHARKGQSDKTTGRDKASINGTKVISNIHDIGCFLTRDEDDDTGEITTRLLVKKVREVPGPNMKILLNFDEERRLFTQAPNQTFGDPKRGQK